MCQENFLFFLFLPTLLSATTGNNGFFSPLKTLLVFSVKFYFLSLWANSSEKQIPTVLCQMREIWKHHTPTLKGTLSLLHGSSKIPMLRAIRNPLSAPISINLKASQARSYCYDSLLAIVVKTDANPAVVQKSTLGTRGSSAHYPGKQSHPRRPKNACQHAKQGRPEPPGPPGKGGLSQAVLIKPDNAIVMSRHSQEPGKDMGGRKGLPSSKINVPVNLGRRKFDSSGNLPIRGKRGSQRKTRNGR